MAVSDNVSFKRKRTTARPKGWPVAQGFTLNAGMRVADLPARMEGLGFQATQLSRAHALLQRVKRDKTVELYLSFTSNIVSSGLREILAQIVATGRVTAIITSTGSIEEDYMKTFTHFTVGEFDADDEQTKKAGLNRIGNVFVPDEAYVEFEARNTAFLKTLYAQTASAHHALSPSHYARFLGEQIANENATKSGKTAKGTGQSNADRSILYQAFRTNTPVYAPGFVDGAIGDHVFFLNQDLPVRERLVIDEAADVHRLYQQILGATQTAGLIIGGGIAKHHLIGAAILRNGLDYAIYVSTGSAGDGSLSGARPTEAVSWNKLKDKKNSVFVETEATLALPLLAGALVF